MKVLITGVAGFVGFHVAQRFLGEGIFVVGVDNLNDYYDVSLKQARLDQILEHSNFSFKFLDISDRNQVFDIFDEHNFDRVIHLAAQAGVRYSLENPFSYIDSNLVGFANILESCRHKQIPHLVYASSSSVYGANRKVPFSVLDSVDHPVSLYAATKKANELMAHSYSHIYRLPTTGLRFFTVYGPWGRPDMAYFKFTKAILENKSIDVFNYGEMQRDFTYIDDVVEGVFRVTEKFPQELSNPDSTLPSAPYKVYNIGNNSPIPLLDFIKVIESELGVEANKNFLPLQPGDVLSTYADVDDLMEDVGFKPITSVESGIHNFVRWYRSYYNQ